MRPKTDHHLDRDGARMEITIFGNRAVRATERKSALLGPRIYFATFVWLVLILPVMTSVCVNDYENCDDQLDGDGMDGDHDIW